MKPLKAQLEELDGSEERLGELFSSADGYRRNPVRKRRIKVAVLSRARERRRRPLGAALAAGLLVAGTATAATLGHRLLMGGEDPIARAPSPPAVHAPRSLPAPRLAQRVPLEVEGPREPPSEPEAGVETAPAPEDAPLKSPAPKIQPKAASQKALAPGEDPTRVVEAIRALRQQKNAKKAQSLLDDYMKKNPNGSLFGLPYPYHRIIEPQPWKPFLLYNLDIFRLDTVLVVLGISPRWETKH
jgi:hypothetical protein